MRFIKIILAITSGACEGFVSGLRQEMLRTSNSFEEANMNCNVNGCRATNLSECDCYQTGMEIRAELMKRRWVYLIATLIFAFAILVVLSIPRQAEGHHVVAPIAAQAFAGGGSAGAAAMIGGAAVVAALIAHDVRKRTRCNLIRDSWVDTRHDLTPRFVPYRDRCADPRPRARRNPVRARG